MAVTFATAVYVESPPPVVFEALTNFEAAPQWMPDFVRLEKLTSTPVGPGTEFRATRKMYGKESTEHFRVTRFERPSRLDLVVDGSKGTSGRGEYRFVYELVPERTGTNLELTGEILMPGVWGLFSRFKVGSFKKAVHKDMEALKAHLESAWPSNPRG